MINFYEKCDPALMKKIVQDWLENMSKPTEVPEAKKFTVHDDEETGKSETYTLNMAHPKLMASMAQTMSIKKFVDDLESDAAYSYGWRIESVMRFIGENKEHLKRNGLIKKTETHSLIANAIYEAAATCKVGAKGFKFLDMDKEIKKYIH